MIELIFYEKLGISRVIIFFSQNYIKIFGSSSFYQKAGHKNP
jgi:hypothetical protein